MELPEGYRVEEVPSPMLVGDVRKWYQAAAPNGTRGLVYSNAWAAAKTAYEHEVLGRWPRKDEFIGLFQGVPPAGGSVGDEDDEGTEEVEGD